MHESVKMDACLTPSDAHVVGSSETGEIRLNLRTGIFVVVLAWKPAAHPRCACYG